MQSPTSSEMEVGFLFDFFVIRHLDVLQNNYLYGWLTYYLFKDN